MTALTHMAAARPPAIADARVPCPLCGGLIHPVAGRCKHCKEDLTQFRAGRPQAAAALPSLNGNGASTRGSNGHAVAAAAATASSFVPVMLPAQDGSQPILPPRTTARSVAAVRPHSMWRSWPMLVIAVAVIAIIAATVIMVMPQDSDRKDGKMSAPPAPERMETNPLPDKQSQLDPWSQPGTVPQAPQPMPPDPPTPMPTDPDDDDIWGGTAGGTLGGGGALGGSNPFGQGGGANFMITALDHACTKLKSCPDIDQSTLTSVCEAVAMMPKPPGPTGCAAAQKCLDAIDKLSCSQAQSASPHSVFTMFDDCTRAATQC
jgi:hypothetical protein